MAVYHFSAQIFSRGKGHSAVAKAAYRAGTKLNDERQGKDWDYTKKENVVHSEIVAPADAPDWIFDREKLWNNVEKSETRKDAQLAREFEIALPRELTREQQIDLVRDFAEREFVSKGFVADVNIHTPDASDGGKQPHAHISVTMRRVDKNGFKNEKKPREMNNREQLLYWRKAWADEANLHLEKAGLDVRIDHRNLKDLREEALQNGDFEKAAELDRMPQTKSGSAATGIKKDGRLSRRAAFQESIKKDGLERQALAHEVINIKSDVQAGKLSRAEAGDRLEKLAVDASKKSDFWKSKGSRVGERHWSSLSSQLKNDAQSTRLGPGLNQAAEKVGGGGKTGKAVAGAALRPGKKPRLPGADMMPKGSSPQAGIGATNAALKKIASAMVKAAMPSPGGGVGSIAKSIIKGPGRRL